MFKTLLTNRLKLRPIREDDAKEIFKTWAQDKDISKYTTWVTHKSIQETKDYIDRAIVNSRQNSFTWIIEKKDTSKMIGCITARLDNHKVNIGYLVVKNQWIKGYMTELIECLILICIDLSIGCHQFCLSGGSSTIWNRIRDAFNDGRSL